MSESESPTSARKPRIMLMADVKGWIFERHCHTLVRLLGDRYDFTIRYMADDFREEDYDLIFPLEWHLIPAEKIQNPAKYVTGIRSHILWRQRDLFEFADLLRAKYQSVHAVSQRLVDTLSGVIPNLSYVTHGVDLNCFRPQTSAALSGPGKLRIGWAGNRANRSKGFEDYILPLTRIPGVELVYCGYVDKNLTKEEMVDFYDSIDCYICASSIHHEGNNNPLMESGAMARAIITTDNGTVPEYLRHGVNALIVEPELPNFVRAVCTLRDNLELRVRLGQSARDAVVAHFDWNVMAERYAAFIDQALANRATWTPSISLAESLTGELPGPAQTPRPEPIPVTAPAPGTPDDLGYWRDYARRLEAEIRTPASPEPDSFERFRNLHRSRWAIVETMDIIRELETENHRLRDAITANERMIDDRDRAMQGQSDMIAARDVALKDQASLLDERWAVMQSMEQMITARDAALKDQAALLDERWAVMQSMDKMIAERDAIIARHRS